MQEIYFAEPILGQEAVVSTYGLGRITSILPNGDIEVTPYVCGYPMTFDRKNVALVSPGICSKCVIKKEED